MRLARCDLEVCVPRIHPPIHSTNPHTPHSPTPQATYDATFLKHYVAAAREFDPHIPPELTAYIVNEYVALRSVSAVWLARRVVVLCMYVWLLTVECFFV